LVKKIIIFLTPILIIAIAIGCSKDHSAPTFSTYKATSSPDSVVATYDKTKDVVDVTWDMSDTSGVGDYFVSVSDSNVFDLGKVRGFYANLTEFAPPHKFVYNAATYVAGDVDSMILYFTVSAVYKNETFKGFIGPRAKVDSALVYRKTD